MGFMAGTRDDEIRVEATVVAETDKALMLSPDGSAGEEEWFPKSQIDWVEPDNWSPLTGMKGHHVVFFIPRWLMQEKGW
jgi:hypothetical protein